jgi:hypothetical protein
MGPGGRQEMATDKYSTGGCSPYPGGAGHAFDPASGNLTLTWTPPSDMPYAPTVAVVFAAFPGEPYFDATFVLVAPPAETPPASGGFGPYNSVQVRLQETCVCVCVCLCVCMCARAYALPCLRVV